MGIMNFLRMSMDWRKYCTIMCASLGFIVTLGACFGYFVTLGRSDENDGTKFPLKVDNWKCCPILLKTKY